MAASPRFLATLALTNVALYASSRKAELSASRPNGKGERFGVMVEPVLGDGQAFGGLINGEQSILIRQRCCTRRGHEFGKAGSQRSLKGTKLRQQGWDDLDW
jgi:hypothetical protein